jgi:hypothetical protein
LNAVAAFVISGLHRRAPTSVVSTNLRTLLWLSGYCFLNYLLFVFPFHAWNKGVSQRTTVASFLASNYNRSVIVAWLERRLNLKVQAALSCLAGAAGGVAVIVARPTLAGAVDICIASVVTIVVTAFLGMNSVYWLWAAPPGIRQVTRCEGLELRWYSPASTPAIQQLSRLLAAAAGLAFIGVAVLFTPALYVFTRLGNRQVLNFLNALLLVIGLSTVVIVGILPQVSLSRIIHQGKRLALDNLAKAIGNSAPSTADATVSRELIGLYEQVRSSPSSAISMEPLLVYGFSLSTALIPVVVQLTVPPASPSGP